MYSSFFFVMFIKTAQKITNYLFLFCNQMTLLKTPNLVTLKVRYERNSI